MLPHNAHIIALLRELACCDLRFLVFGSAGLALHHPHLLAVYPLPDLDLLLPGAHPALCELVRALAERGFEVRSWGEPWQETWSAADLAGRFYLRATRAALRVDATYEATYLAEAWRPEEQACIDGIPVCSEATIWRAKLIKNRSSSLQFAATYGLTIPPEATSTLEGTE